jgi:hypothetical protein
MPDSLPNVAGDTSPSPGPEPATSPAQPGRVLQMRPPESTPETLDERLSEVIEEVQNGGSGWRRFETQVSETWQEISAEAQSLFKDLSTQARRLSQERPLYVIGLVTLASFFLGAVLRATRSRYE